MAWITPTVADVQKALNAPEFSAYTAAALALDAAAILAAQIELARGYCPVKDATAGAVPPELKSAVIKLAVVELLRGVRGLSGDIADTLTRRHDEAMKVLRDTAAGTLRITPPETTAASVSATSGGVAHGAPARTTKREDLAGL